MISLFLTVLALVPPTPSGPSRALPEAAETDLGGVYSTQGFDKDESESYRGLAKVVRQKPNLYVIYYYTGADAVVGLGVREGDRLTVTWMMQKNNEVARGLTLYDLKGQELRGRWITLPGDGEWRKENLKLIKR